MNKKILLIGLVLILLSSFVNAVTLYDNPVNHIPDTANPTTESYGFLINVTKDNVNLEKVILEGTVDATTVHVIFLNKTFYRNITVINYNATFTDTPLAKNTPYYIVVGSLGDTYTRKYKLTAPVPIAETHLTYISGTGWDWVTNDFVVQAHSQNMINIITSNTTAPLPTIDTLNASIPEPATDTQFNTLELNINLTVNSTTDFNCSLYDNISGTYDLDSTNSYTAGINVPVNFNLTFVGTTETSFIYGVYCINTNSSNETKGNYTVHIDNVVPNIVWNIPLSNNGTILFGDNLTANISITDPNLYSYHYNISYPNGTVLYNFTNSTLTGLTEYTVQDISEMAGYSGEFFAALQVCDGHTANEVKFKSVIKYNTELMFDSVNVQPEYKFDIQSYDYVKKRDRYNFDFKTKTAKSSQTYIIESPEYIDILHGQTHYAGHLITGTKWIDFETDDLKYVEITRINDNKVKVKVVKNKPTKDWYFESIGDLNCQTETKSFFVTNHTYSYDTELLSGDTTTFYFNMTYNSDYITTLDVDLHYNNTEYSMTATPGASVYQFEYTLTTPITTANKNISFNFEYTVNSDITNTSEFNQSLFVFNIDDCSTYTTPWINFTIRDEANDSKLLGDIEYYFDWGASTYSGSANGMSNYSFCMFPAWANYTSNILIQYSVPGHDDRNYESTAFRVDNITNQINLYTLLSASSSEVTIHVIDEADNDLEDVLIECEKWDIPTASFQLIEIEHTDSSGNAIFDIVIGSPEYRFKFYQDGILKLTTGKFKIFSTSLEYILAESEESFLSEWLQINNIIRSLTYDNDTSVVTFMWDDTGSIANYFCLNITDFNITFSNCSAASSGSLAYTIPLLNRSYMAYGMARHADSNNWYTLETLTIDTRTGWDVMGNTMRILLSMIVMLFVGLLFLANKNMAIIGECIALTALSMFGILPIGIPAVIGVWFVGVILLIVMNMRATL